MVTNYFRPTTEPVDVLDPEQVLPLLLSLPPFSLPLFVNPPSRSHPKTSQPTPPLPPPLLPPPHRPRLRRWQWHRRCWRSPRACRSASGSSPRCPSQLQAAGMRRKEVLFSHPFFILLPLTFFLSPSLYLIFANIYILFYFINCKLFRVKAWMQKNTKQCPQCQAPIEKNGGVSLFFFLPLFYHLLLSCFSFSFARTLVALTSLTPKSFLSSFSFFFLLSSFL